jgi:predicted lipoprotein with Yx(FWY)xxD motif
MGKLVAMVVVAAAGGGALAAVPVLPAGASGGGAEVHAAKVGGRGLVLVDGSGHTLYVFSPDKGHGVTCRGACASIWPPLTTKQAPAAGHGIKASELGTTSGPNGTRVVTYDHWPLYTYVQDTRPGEDTGQGIVAFGGKWSTITPSGSAFGAPATSKRSTKPSGSSRHSSSRHSSSRHSSSRHSSTTYGSGSYGSGSYGSGSGGSGGGY